MVTSFRPTGRILKKAKRILFRGFVLTLFGGLLFITAFGAFGISLDEGAVFSLFVIGLVFFIIGFAICFQGLVESGFWRPKMQPATDRVVFPRQDGLIAMFAWLAAAILSLSIVTIWEEFPSYDFSQADEAAWGFLIVLMLLGSLCAWALIYAIISTLRAMCYRRTLLILISAPVRLGECLEGVLCFPGSAAPEILITSLVYRDFYATKVVAEGKCRPSSLRETLNKVNERAPGQASRLSVLLEKRKAQTAITLKVPTTVPLTKLPEGVGMECKDLPERNVGAGFWSLKVTAKFLGIPFSRTYSLTMAA